MKNRIFADIRSSCRFVAENAKHIAIRIDRLKEFAASLPPDFAMNQIMDTENHFCDGSEKTLAYFLCLDCINFGSGFFSELKDANGKSGYFLVAWHLREAFRCRETVDADWLMSMSAARCAKIFAQNPGNEIIWELMQLFAAAMNQLGTHLQDNFGGSFVKLRASAENSAAAMVEALMQMPFYQDFYDYQGRRIYLMKRAQITVSDLFLAFSGKGYGRFNDIEELTIFADNLVPHVLFCDGILEYSQELKNRILNRELLASGSCEEIELRACCIHSVELLREELAKRGFCVTSQQLDYLLWNQGQQHKYREKPSHKTRCVFY